MFDKNGWELMVKMKGGSQKCLFKSPETTEAKVRSPAWYMRVYFQIIWIQIIKAEQQKNYKKKSKFILANIAI